MLDASMKQVHRCVVDALWTLNNRIDVGRRGHVARTQRSETDAKRAGLTGGMGVIEIGVDDRSRLREKQHRYQNCGAHKLPVATADHAPILAHLPFAR
jgi:hypothetical protein